MAEAVKVDAQGNPVPDQTSFWDPLAPAITPTATSPESQAQLDAAGKPSIWDVITGKVQSEPAPAPASGAPQLPEFGMGDMNMPPPPTFDQPSDESLTQAGGNGLSGDDQNMRSQASSIFGSDPGAPGGRYSGGFGRKANPLRESDVGKRFAGASKAGTAYGNAFDKEGLLGGGKNAKLAGGDNAEMGSQPSDLLLQMLQLLGQG